MKKKLKVLIVDDDPNMASTLADILLVSGYESITAFSPEKALKIVNEEKVDCVLSDVRMPGMSGVELFEQIQKTKPDLPVVLMTAYAPDDQIQHGLKRGVFGLLTKPIEIHNLLNFLTLLESERFIAVVDDDPVFCRSLADILNRRGFSVRIVSDTSKVLEVITSEVQSVLLDMKLKGMEGHEVLAQIRGKYSDIPVVIITAYREEMAVAIKKAQELDAFACLYKPLDFPQLQKTLNEIFKTRLEKALMDGNQNSEN